MKKAMKKVTKKPMKETMDKAMSLSRQWEPGLKIYLCLIRSVSTFITFYFHWRD